MSSTTFEPELEVKKIKPHPANPRHKAIADDEMVASIKSQGLIQPLVVAPAGDGDGWVVIAGHRRLDGLKKARKRTAPAIIRDDLTTDGQQIEAAIIENVHRVDLSPMEEAEAFEGLRGLKYTQATIAKKTGRPVSTVRERLKLLKLSTKTRNSIHTGQLTIGDALEIVAFDDDPKAQTALVKAAGSADFRRELERQKRLRDNRVKTDAILERLTKDGVNQYDMKGERDIWAAQRKDDQLSRVGSFDEYTYDDHKAKHDGCLGYVLTKDWDGSLVVTLVCTATGSHAEKISKAQREADEAAAERRAMWEAEKEQKAFAKKLRFDTVLNLVPEGAMVPDFLVDQLRVVLPPAAAWIYGELGDEPDVYFDVAGVAADDRFRYGWGDGEEQAKELAFIATYADMPGWRLVRLLMVVLLELTEGQADDDPIGATITSRYFGFLEQLGHGFLEQDTELRDRAELTLTEALADPEPDPYSFVHAKGSNGPGTETPCGLRATTGKTLTTNPNAAVQTCPECLSAEAAS